LNRWNSPSRFPAEIIGFRKVVAMPKLSKPKRIKPSKPHKDYPLTAHPSGRWCKKVYGKLHYFGPWEDPDGALQRWNNEKDDIIGHRPVRRGEGLTCRELANSFLATKEALVDTGELTRHHFTELHRACGRMVDCFGKSTPVKSLHSEDFDRLRARIAKVYGPVALGNEVQRVRSVFNYGMQSGLITEVVRFGTTFKKPSKKPRRLARIASGPRMFEAAELREIIGLAGAPLKAMILLGINCGLGQNDIATMPMAALDLSSKWHRHARPKTGTERRCPLWPETVAALKEAITGRSAASESSPIAPEDADLVFLTKYRRRWVRCLPNGTWVDSIGLEFRKLLIDEELNGSGKSFYSLRRTFRTVADEAGDQPAATYIMGHADADDDMSATYRQKIDDARLKAVVDHVRKWLWPAKPRKAK
jgi:integrase